MYQRTALVFPVKEICDRAKELGLITIIDGAHIPGHIPLNLEEIKADFYTGTLHKWLLGPKGSTFLYVNKNFQNLIEPLIISWGYEAAKPTKIKIPGRKRNAGNPRHFCILNSSGYYEVF